MGWFLDEANGCEGYVRGWTVLEDGREVRLGYPPLGFHGGGWEVGPGPRCEMTVVNPPAKIRWVQLECECGWSSPRMPAPLSAQWGPWSVSMRQEDEDTAGALWADHVRALEGRDPHEALWSHRKRRAESAPIHGFDVTGAPATWSGDPTTHPGGCCCPVHRHPGSSR